MAKVNATFCFLTFLLCLAFCSCSTLPFDAHNQKQAAHWCVANFNAPQDKLQGFLDFACSKYVCREILPGGRCFEPNTLLAHASYALNLNYRVAHDCPSDIGLPTASNPSYGDCYYP